MILVDTQVLVYAVGTPHPLRERCRRLMVAQQAGYVDAAVTPEVLQEFVWVRAARQPRPEAVARARGYMTLFAMLRTTAQEVDIGLRLFQRYIRLGSFDAVLAAIALNRQLDALVSADRAFAEVPGLPWIDPATPELDRLLANR